MQDYFNWGWRWGQKFVKGFDFEQNCRICPMYLDRQARANSADSDRTPHSAASDQCLHCLLLFQQFETHP